MTKTCKNNLFKRLAYFAIVFSGLVFTPVSAIVAQQGTSIKTLVIDAGHGGKDPGAIGPYGHKEAQLALAVALKFGALIQEHFPQIKTIYTRKTDVFLTLNERADIANKAKADLFFCIHLNSATNKLASGSSTYALGLHRSEENLEVAKRENAVIELEEGGLKNYEFDPNTPEGHIIMSMKQNAFLDQSLRIASSIEEEQTIVSKRKSRGVKQAGFYVLYKTSMPSILTEIGFVSNPEEEQFLASERGQKLIALSLFRGFLKYKNTIEGKNEKIDLSKHMPKEEEEPRPGEIIIEKTNPTSVNPLKAKADSTFEKSSIPTESTLVSNSVATPEKNDAALVFRIQLQANTVFPKNRAEIENKFGAIVTEKLPNGIIRFMVGNYDSAREARSHISQAQKLGFSDAFINAYENGLRVSNKRLAELLK